MLEDDDVPIVLFERAKILYDMFAGIDRDECVELLSP